MRRRDKTGRRQQRRRVSGQEGSTPTPRQWVVGPSDRRADHLQPAPRRPARLRGIHHDKGSAIADPADLLCIILIGGFGTRCLGVVMQVMAAMVVSLCARAQPTIYASAFGLHTALTCSAIPQCAALYGLGTYVCCRVVRYQINWYDSMASPLHLPRCW